MSDTNVSDANGSNILNGTAGRPRRSGPHGLTAPIAIKPPSRQNSSQQQNAATQLPVGPVISCTLERSAKLNGPQNVGERMTLTCQGDIGGTLEKAAQVKADDQHQYSLVVLDVLDTSAQSFKASVTSYRVGDHSNESFTISDGKVTFQTSPQNFKLESVIQPKQGEQPKPFPSYGPFTLAYPMWLWLAIGAVILVIALGIFWGIWRRQKRRRLLAELEKFTTMLPPFGQFSKDARQSVKKLSSLAPPTEASPGAAELVKKIDEDFRSYLIRELKVPALQVSNREIIREIRRAHPAVFLEYQGDLRRILFELDRATRDAKAVAPRDCEELLFLSRKVADNIYAVKRRQK